MSVKVTTPQDEKPFPKIMKGELGSIVLFREPKKGTLIIPKDGFPVGYYQEQWNMDVFTDYNQPITLQND
jgi:hypothetical protein